MARDIPLRAKFIVDDTQIKKGFKSAEKSMNSFTSSLKTIGPIVAAAFSVNAIAGFFKTSIQGLADQEKAEASLLNSLNGRLDVTNQLIDQAKELSRITLFEDSDIIRGQSILAVFVKQEESLKKLMPLVLDFASKFQTDIPTAAKMVGKSITGSAAAMEKLGFEIDGASGTTERFNSVYEQLQRVMGAAEAEASTNMGSVQQLGKAWGEFGETLVNFIGPALRRIATGLTDVTQAADDFTSNKNVGFWTKLKMTFAGATGNISNVATIWANNYTPAVEEATKESDGLATSLESVADALDKVIEKAVKMSEETKNRLKDMAENGNLWFGPGGGSTTLEDYMNVSGLQVQGNAKQPGLLNMRPVELDFFNNKMKEMIDWTSVAQTAFVDLGEAMAAAFQKGANFGEIFLQLLIKMAALIAGTAIGGPVGGMIGSLIGGFGSGMLNAGGVGGGSIQSKIFSQSPQLMSGAWRIRGEDLVYVINKQQNKLSRY